ncbi:MAG: hypothetical protein ABGY41_17190, partial [Candidatus Poribacteria bacterium]
YEAFRAAQTARVWLRKNKAICFYGVDQPSRNVQIHGLRDASRTWRIPFYIVTVGSEAQLTEVLAHDSVLFITTLSLVPALAPHMGRCNGSIALIAGNYDGAPRSSTIQTVTDDEARLLDEHRDCISVALSEYSPAGIECYCRGFVENHGIPVMSFT